MVAKKTLIRTKKVKSSFGPVDVPLRASKQNLAYNTMVASGIPSKQAKSLAGYNPESKPVLLTGTLDQQREKALEMIGISLYSQFKALYDVQQDKAHSCASDVISATKAINTMVPGFVAPSEIKINSTAIIAEFRDMSSSDLANLAHMLNVNQGVQNRCTVDVDDVQVIDYVESGSDEQLISNPLEGEDE